MLIFESSFLIIKVMNSNEQTNRPLMWFPIFLPVLTRAKWKTSYLFSQNVPSPNTTHKKLPTSLNIAYKLQSNFQSLFPVNVHPQLSNRNTLHHVTLLGCRCQNSLFNAIGGHSLFQVTTCWFTMYLCTCTLMAAEEDKKPLHDWWWVTVRSVGPTPLHSCFI